MSLSAYQNTEINMKQHFEKVNVKIVEMKTEEEEKSYTGVTFGHKVTEHLHYPWNSKKGNWLNIYSMYETITKSTDNLTCPEN